MCQLYAIDSTRADRDTVLTTETICVFQTSEFKMQTKRIIVEFGVRRQRVVLKDRAILLPKLCQLIGVHFGIPLENRSMYTLQMWDETLKAFRSLDESTSSLDLIRDVSDCHRFRIIETPLRTRVRLNTAAVEYKRMRISP